MAASARAVPATIVWPAPLAGSCAHAAAMKRRVGHDMSLVGIIPREAMPIHPDGRGAARRKLKQRSRPTSHVGVGYVSVAQN